MGLFYIKKIKLLINKKYGKKWKRVRATATKNWI